MKTDRERVDWLLRLAERQLAKTNQQIDKLEKDFVAYIIKTQMEILHANK